MTAAIWNILDNATNTLYKLQIIPRFKLQVDKADTGLFTLSRYSSGYRFESQVQKNKRGQRRKAQIDRTFNEFRTEIQALAELLA